MIQSSLGNIHWVSFVPIKQGCRCEIHFTCKDKKKYILIFHDIIIVALHDYQKVMWPWYSSCSPVDGNSRSTVGTDAMKTRHSEATTWLDLGRGHDDYKRHLVLHEFGHVLGLGHEHQSPKAWYFIDEKKAIDELAKQYIPREKAGCNGKRRG